MNDKRPAKPDRKRPSEAETGIPLAFLRKLAEMLKKREHPCEASDPQGDHSHEDRQDAEET